MLGVKNKKTSKFERLNWLEFEKIIQQTVKKIGRQGIKYDAIMGISRGGLVPGVLLSHRLGVKNFQIAKVVSYKFDAVSSGKVKPKIEYLDYKKIKRGQRILIADDIADTGETLAVLMDELKRQTKAKFDIFVVTKSAKLRLPPSLKLKFIGRISHRWVIFPWEELR
jgi:hypoxanthine phosphoribosyltransferase